MIRRQRMRVAASMGAITATAPYLALKIDWAAGGTAGMTDPARLGSSLYRVANGATIIADLVAATLALALMRPWGRRLPALLVVLPMWCGTGLLGVILVLLPLALPAVLTNPQPQAAGLASWVYVLVYAGFAVQGVSLLTASALYAVDRWPGLLRPALPLTATPNRRRVVVVLAGSLALAAGLQAAWAFGVTAGLGSLPTRLSAVDRVSLLVHALANAAAAAGAARLVQHGAAQVIWRPGLLLWAGTAATVTWGGYFLAYSTADPAGTSAALTAVTAGTVTAATVTIVLLARPIRAVVDVSSTP